jgi:transcriptional regulator of aromatic amino acid metabolism
VAKAIHYNSPRKDEKFVTINCGAISENLIESELFGHEKGAFTGADQRKIGKFQFAEGGTIFLDEIGDISAAMQVKLLRVLQEKTFMPVGSNREIKVDVRIIAASHKPFEEMIKEGTFREDLFYRLNVLPVYLPPLRERKTDIPHLVNHYINYFNKTSNSNLEKYYRELELDWFYENQPINKTQIVSNTSNSYNLVCMDDSRRVFTCTRDGRMWVDGKGSSRVNAILRKISKELKNEEEVAGFTVTKNEI